MTNTRTEETTNRKRGAPSGAGQRQGSRLRPRNSHSFYAYFDRPCHHRDHPVSAKHRDGPLPYSPPGRFVPADLRISTQGHEAGLVYQSRNAQPLPGCPRIRFAGGSFPIQSGMQFGYPRPSEFVRLTWDEDLFWRLDPSLPAVNSLGFPGDEFQIPKPDGVYRILYLGDSCTQQGYPEIVEGMLNEQRPQEGIIIESVSLAVPGYTSHQGRILAEQLGQSVDPNLVVVYFGWNDHWLAFDSKDSEKQLDTSGATRLYYDLQRYRLAQFLFWISDTVLKVRSVPIEEVRVPKQEYNENLSRIVGTFHSRDVPVILITAPTSHYRLGVPDYLVELHFVEDKAAAVELHREYNVAVRDFSDTEALYLLDLEREFNELTTDEMSRIFMADGIHFTPYGLEEVAARLTEFINNNIFQTTMP